MTMTPSEKSIADVARAAALRRSPEGEAHPRATDAISDLYAQIKTLNSELLTTRRRLQHYEEEEANRETAEAKREEAEERREARAKERSRQADTQVREARIAAIRAIARLLPQAVNQAKRGKPALLRMILRATK